MTGLVLRGADTDYARLDLLAWSARGPGRAAAVDGSGLAPIAQDLRGPGDLPLVVDCRRIIRLDDHAGGDLRDVLEDCSRPLIFVRVGALSLQLREALGNPAATYTVSEEVGEASVYADPVVDPKRVLECFESARSSHLDYIESLVKTAFHEFPDGPHRLASTPLLAQGVFDARGLISARNRFAWTVAAIADELEDLMPQTRTVDLGEVADPVTIRPLGVLAVSLRGSPFAAAAALLTGSHQRLQVIDHVGPKHRILEEHRLGVLREPMDYILVSDFVVGGTELKIAEAYAQLRGGELVGAVAIGTALSVEEYGTSFQIRRLVDLMDCCPAGSFKFASASLA